MTRRVDPAQIEAIIRKPYTIEVMQGEDPAEGVVAQVSEWLGCLTAGATREEALSRIDDAMYDWVEGRLEDGLDIPPPMSESGGTVVVKMPRTLHSDIRRRAAREGVSMNQWISTTLARVVGAPDGARVTRSPTRRAAARR